jgi:hypothetical protein
VSPGRAKGGNIPCDDLQVVERRDGLRRCHRLTLFRGEVLPLNY